MKTKKPTKRTRAQIEREIIELKAQLASQYHFAHESINKCSVNHLTGSGVLLQLSSLGGNELVNPIVIRDGLSVETITAIKNDLKRSYDLATAFKIT